MACKAIEGVGIQETTAAVGDEFGESAAAEDGESGEGLACGEDVSDTNRNVVAPHHVKNVVYDVHCGCICPPICTYKNSLHNSSCVCIYVFTVVVRRILWKPKKTMQ